MYSSDEPGSGVALITPSGHGLLELHVKLEPGGRFVGKSSRMGSFEKRIKVSPLVK